MLLSWTLKEIDVSPNGDAAVDNPAKFFLFFKLFVLYPEPFTGIPYGEGQKVTMIRCHDTRQEPESF